MKRICRREDETVIIITMCVFQMNALDRGITDSGTSDDSSKIATDVLVVFARGISTAFERAVAWFPVRCLTAGELMDVVWLIKHKIELFSFCDKMPRLKIVTITCDGLAANHLFFKLHGRCREELQYKAEDPFDPGNFVYFIIDPPHLLKTVRNNCEKSSEDENAVKYLCNDQPILWRHVEEVYHDDVQNTWR
jgi:hypothetical protein